MAGIGTTGAVGAAPERKRPGPNFLIGPSFMKPILGFTDELWFETDTQKMYHGTDAGWVEFTTGGFPNPMTTLGDLIEGDVGGAPLRLPVGTAGQILTVVAGVPAWAAPPSSGFANPMTTLGDLITGGVAGAPGRLGVGTNGQTLTVVGGVPTWSTAVARQILWDAAYVSIGTVLGTELNSLANAARTNAGTEVSNQTALSQFAKVELLVTFGSAPSVGGFVNVYMLTASDGTNYEDGSSSIDPQSHRLVATIPVRNVTTAQRLSSRIFALEPSKTKFILTNQTGVAFPASGSTLVLYTANDEVQ